MFPLARFRDLIRIFIGILFLLGLVSGRAEQSPVFDIPRLEKITIDGRADDWSTNGFRVDAMVDNDGVARPASEFASRFRLGWDERGLLVLVTVHDPTPVEEKNDAQFYLRDSVEMFIADQSGGQEAFQVVFVPGRIAGQRELRFHVYDRRASDELKKTPIVIEAARTADAENCTLEVCVPWQNLGIKPETGREILFQLCVNDASPTGPRLQSRWYPGNSYGNTRLMYRLRLAESPSSAVVVAAGASYERLRRTQVGVVATGALTGQVITVRAADRELGSGPLIADGDTARLHLDFPMPARGKPYGLLTVQLAGQTFTTLQLPDADEARQQAFARAEFNFTPCVFTGETFPPCDFQQPSLVEDAVGPYRISKVTFYDADFNVVTTAEKPGRYGAITEICTADGKTFKRFNTLFRQIAECKRKDAQQRFTVELPPELGINPEVVHEQAVTLNDFLREEVVAGFQRTANGAIVLAGLSETAAGSSPAHRQNNAQARDAEWWYRLKKQTGEIAPLQYLTYLPENYDSVSTQRWPVVLFLHGSGERGNDLNQVKKNGLPHLIEAGKHFPFITIAPQCPSNEWWNVIALRDLLDEVGAKYHVDSDRVYLTGLSMGGYGTWSLATRFPERFAAIVPICGGGDPEAVADIKNLPVWVFHGAKDRVVSPQQSQEMVDALQKLGAPVRFTLYPEANHNSWTPAYATEELYTWLLQQHRGQLPAH